MIEEGQNLTSASFEDVFKDIQENMLLNEANCNYVEA
jgi:hypothetical protein